MHECCAAWMLSALVVAVVLATVALVVLVVLQVQGVQAERRRRDEQADQIDALIEYWQFEVEDGRHVRSHHQQQSSADRLN